MSDRPIYYDADGQPATSYPTRGQVREAPLVTELPWGGWVSTVFLAIDHQFGDGPPLLWETMVFPSDVEWEDLDMERYSTRELAAEGHARMVARWQTDRREQDDD